MSQALRELLEHPVPLLAANVAWAGVVFVALTAWLVSPVAGLIVSVPVAWPAAAMAAVAARVVRGDDVRLADAFRWPLSRPAVPVLGLAATLGLLVASVDIAAALDRGDLLGVAFATVAGWAMVALVLLACVAWPLLGDPRRTPQGTRGLLRLAIAVVLLHTTRVVLTALVVGVVLAASAILVAPLLSVSMCLAALVLCHVVLPLADGVEPIVDVEVP